MIEDRIVRGAEGLGVNILYFIGLGDLQDGKKTGRVGWLTVRVFAKD